jgi:hypothetical protein
VPAAVTLEHPSQRPETGFEFTALH